MRLSEGTKDKEYKIMGLAAGRGARSRLLDMGLTIGVVIKSIIIHSYGPILIEVRGTRLAIGHGLARKIMVSEVE